MASDCFRLIPVVFVVVIVFVVDVFVAFVVVGFVVIVVLNNIFFISLSFITIYQIFFPHSSTTTGELNHMVSKWSRGHVVTWSHLKTSSFHFIYFNCVFNSLSRLLRF